jgi:hypothetical protein
MTPRLLLRILLAGAASHCRSAATDARSRRIELVATGAGRSRFRVLLDMSWTG